MKAILSVASGVRSICFNEVLELLLHHLFEVRDPANVSGIPAGLAEHVGADQPLHHDGKPGSEVIPDVTVADEDDDGREIEGKKEPGSPECRLHLAGVVLELGQLVAGYGIVEALAHVHLTGCLAGSGLSNYTGCEFSKSLRAEHVMSTAISEA